MYRSLIVGGIKTIRATRADLAAIMVADCDRARTGDLPFPRIMISSNGSVIAKYHRDAAFRAVIDQADAVDADGMPLIIASKWLCKEPLIERVATTDFIHNASAAAVQNGIRFYFLGAKPGIAAIAASHFRKLFAGLQIVGVRDGYFSLEDESAICREIRALGTDVLWVGLGSPRQEEFALRNREELTGLSWIKTCGGLFDHYAGRLRRAPLWMQNWGLEWLYRMLREPFRLGPRYMTTNLTAVFYLVTATSDDPKRAES